MNLHTKLLEREAAGQPVTVGVIGAGKFGTMFLAQAGLTRGMHVVGVADLDIARAKRWSSAPQAGCRRRWRQARSLTPASTAERTLRRTPRH